MSESNSYLDKEGLEYLLEQLQSKSGGGGGSSLKYLSGQIIFSVEEMNPAEEFGGTWTYLEDVHLFQGWYIYVKADETQTDEGNASVAGGDNGESEINPDEIATLPGFPSDGN